MTLRLARVGDADNLLVLWGMLFDSPGPDPWQAHARDWFAAHVADRDTTRIPVVVVGGQIVAVAVGTFETGVPNPHSPTGRGVRLANVVTLPDHRGEGYATALVRDVITWARQIGADRIDLSATPDGLRIYQALGFVHTSAPRLKLKL